MSKSKEVRLIGAWPSPFVIRARIALNIKSVEYEFLQETFGSKSELLLKSNPVHKKIPVLLHQDKPICESLIIVQYIDEVWSSGPSILPSDPYDRALARFWAAYVDEKLFPSMRGISTAQGEEAKKAAIELFKDVVVVMEDAFGKCGKGKVFFGGEEIGLVDIAFGSMLGWLRVTENMNGVKVFDETTTPKLLGWVERFSAADAVKDVMPETEKLMEFAKLLQAKMRDAAAAAATPK
ncbi:glutathione S-transferase U17-like [Tripterygium wilfordii]|uniref:glutathione S-transferase U17-like n=1 Tax=Tripterygium wilfordii TaxID=458696 RepID=UPI0018F861CD|nr:glutathione S-transferase U17-like [Tripterygium wilfordii]